MQLLNRNLVSCHRSSDRGGRLLASNAAELLVIDERLDGRVVAAHRAARVAANLEFLELHLESVIEHEPADERRAFAQDNLDRLGRLDAADEAGEYAQDASFSAARHFARRRRLGIQAAIAWSRGRREYRRLAIEAKDAAVDVRLLEQHAGIVDQIARREVVGAVDDDVVGLEKLQGVGRAQPRLVEVELDFGIDGLELVFGRLQLGPAYV